MKDYWEQTLESVLAEIDRAMDDAYFTPLGPGDSLALMFGRLNLKGLDPDEAARALTIIDNLEGQNRPDGGIDAGALAQEFFDRLRKKCPEVVRRLSEPEEEMFLDPAGALNMVLARSADAIRAWAASGPDETDPGPLGEEVDQALPLALAALDGMPPGELADDLAWRRYLRTKMLPRLSPRARPALYLAAWVEYVRKIMDPVPQFSAGKRTT